MELDSLDAEAHNNLGITLQELGRLDEAEASYRQAIALGIGYMEAHRNLANILRELGRIEQAIESDRYAIFLSSAHAEETELEKGPDNLSFKNPSPIEFPALYRPGMGTENVGGFLRAMAHMLRPKNILEIGAGYTTPFLLEAFINNKRVYDDGNLKASYFKNYIYESKLVVIDNSSLGELSKKQGWKILFCQNIPNSSKGILKARQSYCTRDMAILILYGSTVEEPRSINNLSMNIGISVPIIFSSTSLILIY